MRPIPKRTDHPKEVFLQFANNLDFFGLIGLEVVDIDAGWSKTQLSWRTDLCQPTGIMHGGMIATLIDTGIAYALLMTEAVSQAQGFVSVDLRVKYLRPVSKGTIICESTIPHLGRRIFHGESIVTDGDGREIARGDSMYMLTGTAG